MRRPRIVFLALLFGASLAAYAAPDIAGVWEMRDDKTGNDILICLYPFEGKMYGRILLAYDPKTGLHEDDLTAPLKRAERLVGDPPYCGLDLVYCLVDVGKSWYGCIIDPETGDEYSCNIWMEGVNLKVRGELKGLLSFLGREFLWTPAPPEAYPAGFSPPDPSSFVPAIPKKK